MASDAAWSEAVAREAVIRRLILLEHPGRSDLLRACHELGVKRTRLYELIRAYRERPVTSSLLALPAGTRQGSRRLSEEAEAVIAEAIRISTTRARNQHQPSAKEVRRFCAARGFDARPGTRCGRGYLPRSGGGGSRAGRPQGGAGPVRPVPGEYRAEYPLEVVQIDHTLVDVIVVDRQTRRPLQRPWLTLAVDVASRTVAGFHLALEPPSAISVALAIQNFVLPKDAFLSRLGVAAEWPAAGLPDAIHLDNAKEFRSRALRRAAEEYGIELIHRPVATPHYGGHIERLIGSMMGAVHLLPGTTFSRVAERGTYDSSGQSALTLDELERW